MSTDIVTLDGGWIGPAMRLSEEAGWNQVPADWAVFMTHGTVLGVIEDGQLVGSAAVLPYGENFGWISMVLVTTGWRGRGIATKLVASCVALLRDAGRAAFLDATPAGAMVYGALGFKPLCTMQRWLGAGGGQTRTAGIPDFSPDAFGADRSFLLNDFLARPGSFAIAVPDGFAVVRAGRDAAQIGPVVAAAPSVLAAAIDAAPGRVVVDLLDAGPHLMPELIGRGFQPLRPFTRMALGAAALPGDPSRALVAAGPEFG